MASWQSQFHLCLLFQPICLDSSRLRTSEQVSSFPVLFWKGNLQSQTSQRGCISCPTQCLTEQGTKDPVASLSGCEVSSSHVSERWSIFNYARIVYMFLRKGLKRTLEQKRTEDTQCIWYLVFIWSDLLTDTPDSWMLLTLSLSLPSFLLCFSSFLRLLYFSVRRCSQLFAPDNGYMNCDSDGDNYGATCSFKCTGGHELSGSAARVCQYGLTWSGTETKCSRKSGFFPFSLCFVCINDSFIEQTLF